MCAQGREHTPKTITVVVVNALNKFPGTGMEPTLVRRNCQHSSPFPDLSQRVKYKSSKLFRSQLRVRAAYIQVEAHNLIQRWMNRRLRSLAREIKRRVQPGHLVHGRSLLGTWKGHRTPTEEFGDLPGILVTILDQPLLSGESREGLNLHVHGWGT